MLATVAVMRHVGRCVRPSAPFLGRRAVVVYGKKRLKRRGPLRVPDSEPARGSVTDYLEFGAALGLSVEESLERFKRVAQNENLELDADAEAMIHKLEKQRTAKAKNREMMERVVKGELNWEEIEKAMKRSGIPVREAPIWATAKKFARPQVRHEDLLPKEAPQEDSGAYGRFLLTDADLSEGFGYEELEAMIAELPEELMPEGRWHDEMPESQPQSLPEAPMPERRRPIPALAQRPALYAQLSTEAPQNATEPQLSGLRETKPPRVKPKPVLKSAARMDTVEDTPPAKLGPSFKSSDQERPSRRTRTAKLRPRPKDTFLGK